MSRCDSVDEGTVRRIFFRVSERRIKYTAWWAEESTCPHASWRGIATCLNRKEHICAAMRHFPVSPGSVNGIERVYLIERTHEQ